MTINLFAFCFDARDPVGLSRFWAGLLGWDLADNSKKTDNSKKGSMLLRPADDTSFGFRFRLVQQPETGQEHLHLHLTSTSAEDQQQTVARSLQLGARHVDVGQRPEEGHVVLADPEGNEFCVIEPGNAYLAGCGFFGEITCEGSPRVGYFWREALGWPLVWERDQQTAIQSPQGGPKLSWDGAQRRPKTGAYRHHFDLAPADPADQQAEIGRLIALGATHADTGVGEDGWVVMADPDGYEFWVLTSR